MAGIDSNRRRTALLTAILLGMTLAACGGGGGDPADSPEDLYVVTFSVPDFSGIFLNEQVSFLFSEELKADSINFDSVRLRTGPNGGIAPRGEFVRGTFSNGTVDSSKTNVITFLPAVPNKVDLSDTGYAAGATYTVVVPAWPETNTLLSRGNDPVIQIYASRFTTIPSNAPQRFLDSDFPGSPDVVGITPRNGADEVPVTSSVRITFSEPLLPASVHPTDPASPNIALLNISVSPPQLIPVSYFLAQTRESVSVTLNPLSPLEEGRVYQVLVNSLVTDLVGNAVAPFVASFSTGGEAPPPTAFAEDFTTNFQEDIPATTANWNNRYDGLIGGATGILSSVFAPFAGDGADGDLTIGPGQTVTLNTGTTTQRIYRYTSVSIAVGGTLKATGDYALVIQSQGDVSMAGTIDLSGENGETGISGDGTQNETGTDAGEPTGGAGGAGGPGGYAGGDGGNTVTGTDGGHLKGIDGQGPGGGYGGYDGDLQATNSNPVIQFQLQSREGGGGGGHADSGDSSDTARSTTKGGGTGGVGGDSYGSETFSDAALVNGIRVLTKGFGGSGGGGGGAEDDAGAISNANPNTGVGDGIPANDDEGGGGGGGGGGALQIMAYGDVSITGTIICNGGDGGDTLDPSNNIGQGEAGGGGAGGAIWVRVYGDLTLGSGAVLACQGGVGGNFSSASRKGGGGAPGYIRLEDGDGTIDGISGATIEPQLSTGFATTGTYSPNIALTSRARSTWFNAQRASPRYGMPEETFSLNGGTVVIEYQATHEDFAQDGPNPDLDPEVLSPWVTASQIDQITNRQWIRFRVTFTIPEDHPFDTPIPLVDEIRVPITFD